MGTKEKTSCIGVSSHSFCLFRTLWLLSLFLPSHAVLCIHCKNSIQGCGGGDACPTITDVAANVKVFQDLALGTAPSLYQLLPPSLTVVFTRPVCEALVGIITAPVGAAPLDFSADKYREAQAIVKAAQYGHCSYSDATAELIRRMAAAEGDALTRLKISIDFVKDKTDVAHSQVQGVYTFIWGKVGKYITSRTMATTRLNVAGPSTSKATDLVVSI